MVVTGRDDMAAAAAAAAPGGARVLGRFRGGDGSLSGDGLGDCGGSPEDMTARRNVKIYRLEGVFSVLE